MNFFDQTDGRFAHLRNVLDAAMKKLTRDGLAVPQKSAQPVSETDEKQLWNNGVFWTRNAKSLQYTVFFYNCKLFAFRGGDEHRDLTTDQFTFGSDENGKFVEFKGKNSKTFSGGLKQRRLEAKQIRHYDAGSGIVDMYRLYIEKVGNGTFYKRPLVGDSVRCSEQVV